MSILSRTGVEALIQPVAVSVIAFALGYQVRSYLSSSSPLRGEWKDRSNKKRKLAPSESTAASPRAASTPIPSAGIAAGDKEGGSSSGSESDGATDSDSDAEDERAAASFDLNSVTASAVEEVKLVLVVNDSLKMQKGKIAAQAGHATLACALMLKDANPRLYRNWQRQGQPKIALRCATTEDLEVLAAQARSLNLCARTIQDAGRTQVAPGSKTILGIGPGPARLINTVTGKLKLL